MTLSGEWQEEELYFTGDSYFAAICREIELAKISIDIEVYIFEKGGLADRITKLLEQAAGRGVVVKVLTDGFGSPNWTYYYGDKLEAKGIETAVYNELPWRRLVRRPLDHNPRRSLIRLFGLINKRDHRKLLIFDGRRAFAGSFNITDDHLAEFKGDRAWRDTGISVCGEGVDLLCKAFNLAFRRSQHNFPKLFKKKANYRSSVNRTLVNLNVTRRQRRSNYRELLMRILSARRTIQIETAYFVPRYSLLRALKRAAKGGAKVELIVPKSSDVFFMEYVTKAYYQQLLAAGVELYEYLPSFLHAKSILIDDWAIIGSTNLNHRSLLHDLELDIVLSRKENRELLSRQFEIDRGNSEKVTADEWQNLPRWKKMLARILLAFRQWL